MNVQRITAGHRLTEIPYHADCSRLFEALADLPWAMFLDSGRPRSQQGRYDILVADPLVTLVIRGEETQICGEGIAKRSRRPALELLRELLGEPYSDYSPLPFRGGAVGLFGYELRCDPANPHAADSAAGRFPDMAIGLHAAPDAGGGGGVVAEYAQRRLRGGSAAHGVVRVSDVRRLWAQAPGLALGQGIAACVGECRKSILSSRWQATGDFCKLIL